MQEESSSSLASRRGAEAGGAPPERPGSSASPSLPAKRPRVQQQQQQQQQLQAYPEQDQLVPTSNGAQASMQQQQQQQQVVGESNQIPPEERPQPPSFLRSLRSSAIGAGCDIKLRVTVTGNPRPQLAWHKDNAPVGGGGHGASLEEEEYGCLWIRDCQPGDSGSYTCVASNSAGAARTTARLTVIAPQGRKRLSLLSTPNTGG